VPTELVLFIQKVFNVKTIALYYIGLSDQLKKKMKDIKYIKGLS